MTSQKTVFKNFEEYWYYARFFTDRQKEILLKSFSRAEKDNIMTSYINEGWSELFTHNSLDKIIDDFKNKSGYDLLDIRTKVLKGKSVYMPKHLWNSIINLLQPYIESQSSNYIIGGIYVIDSSANPNIVLLTNDPVNKD